MEWEYEGNALTEVPDGALGFVYRITAPSGRMYIGQKKFISTRAKMVKTAKGTKRKRRIKSESDWRDYYGSNSELQAEVKASGGALFHREILRICQTKSECNYYEMKEQVLHDVLLKPDEYYNSYIGGRISRKHLAHLIG